MPEDIRMTYFLGFVCFGGLAWVGLLMVPTWWTLIRGGIDGYSQEPEDRWFDGGLRAFGLTAGVAGLAIWSVLLYLAWSFFWESIA
jgi:hypothetical protein